VGQGFASFMQGPVDNIVAAQTEKRLMGEV
jgi:hypothetical protein